MEEKMKSLEEFVELLSGKFDNSRQFQEMCRSGKEDFPFARHINTVCNEKIKNLPQSFEGIFLVEESYYTVKEKTHGSAHLFLFTQEQETIKLTSYELPEGCEKSTFTFDSMEGVDYMQLQVSRKFTPAIYRKKDGVWEGGSVSMFSPVLRFTLFERFSADKLEVTETMEVNGKRTFGYDEPILYERIPGNADR